MWKSAVAVGGYVSAVIASKSGILRGTLLVGLVLLLIHTTQALALGFGDIRVRSALNEPLDATLDLVSLSAQEQASLSVGVATPEMFKRFGIERSSLAEELRVETSQVGDGRVSVRLTTRGPVREPFLRFLIQADTSDGKALREYTVLLDPPGAAPPPVAPPAPAVAPPQPPRSQDRRSAPAPSPRQSGGRRAGSGGVNRYGPVSPGDTLFGIAEQTRRPGTSQEQMQVAIFRDNPGAFHGTMDMLLSGTTLSIPPAERVAAIDEAEARATIRAQRRETATRTVSSASADESSTKSSATTATEPPPATTNATLRLEAPRVGTGDESNGFFGRLVMPAPVVDQAGSSAGEPAAIANAGSVDDPAPGPNDSALAPRAPVEVSPDAIIETEQPAAEAATGTQTEPVSGEDTTSTENTEPAPVSTGSSSAPATEPDDSRPLGTGEQDVVAVAGDGLLRPRNMMLLLLALVLIGLLLVWNRRRQYRPVTLSFEDDEPGAGADDAGPAGAPVAPVLDDTPAAPGRDTASRTNTPVTPPVVVASAVVRQADEQMRGGEFDAARDTLEHGLEAHPDDAALQDKCLELNYLAGNKAGFAADVDRFEQGLAGSGVRWAGVAAMGRVLLPDDPRFQTREAAPIPSGISMPAPGRFFADDDPAIEPPWQSAGPVDPPSVGAGDRSMDHDRELEIGDGLEEPADDTPTPTTSPVPGDSIDTPVEDEGSDELGLDMENDSAQAVDWQPSEVRTGQAREHDQGSDQEGLAFELDTSDYRAVDSGGRTAAGRSAPPEMAPIDTSEFDLGDAGPNDGSDSYGDAQAAGDSDSIGIRLDLARMYIDMEDGEAARELLEEVIAEGSDSQKAEARGLLEHL